MKRLSPMSLVASASPVVVRDLQVWLTSVREDARRLGYRPSSFDSLELGELMEDECAGHGFDIRESDPDFDAFNTRIEPDPEVSEDGCAIDQPYWTTTGDDPVIDDQYVCADKERSAAGFVPSDTELEPNPWDEPVINLSHANEWSEFRKYLARQKTTRQELCASIFEWVRKQTSALELKKQLSRFRQKNQASFRRCSRLNDWTSLWLTKDQARAIERYFSIRLARLP